MFWVWVIGIIFLILITIVFDTGILGAIGIVIGVVVVCILFAYAVIEISAKYPKVADFLTSTGKIISNCVLGAGLVLTIIGLFTDSITYGIGPVVAAFGAIMRISAWLVSAELVNSVLKNKKGQTKILNKTYQMSPKSIERAVVGSVVTFGQYYQNNDNYKEDIRWIVLEEKRDRLLLISEKVLNGHCYNKKDGHITWGNCDLRKWLHNVFINEAFTASEQERILSTNVTTLKNPTYNIDGGNDTVDKIFVLSIEEFEKYLSGSEMAKCKPTQFAINRNVFADPNSDNCCCWWLRTPGKLGRGCFVFFDGTDNGLGEAREKMGGIFLNGVRPAMWVKK